MVDLTLTFLGTGTSQGIPMLTCDCAVCHSKDPRDNRTRASIYLETPESSFVVDTGPDFRQQALRERIHRVDAVVFTHAHTDHIMGFDDLRSYCTGGKVMPVYGSADTLGLVHGLAVTEANLNDRAGATLLVWQLLERHDPRLATLLVDHGYDGPELAQWVLETSGWEVEVVCKRPGQQGCEVQPKRWIVERTLGWLNCYRRLSKEYEALPASSEAFIRIAMIHVMVRRLEKEF